MKLTMAYKVKVTTRKGKQGQHAKIRVNAKGETYTLKVNKKKTGKKTTYTASIKKKQKGLFDDIF